MISELDKACSRITLFGGAGSPTWEECGVLAQAALSCWTTGAKARAFAIVVRVVLPNGHTLARIPLAGPQAPPAEPDAVVQSSGPQKPVAGSGAACLCFEGL